MMKIVSYEEAKALKEFGYPQDSQRYQYGYEGNLVDLVRDGGICYGPVAPSYMEVWRWLWREKNIIIEVEWGIVSDACACSYSYCNDKSFEADDPEDAIIASIKYLIENDLIK